MTQPNPSEIAQLLAQSMAVITEALAPVREAVEGYRALMEREGYGDALARKMAADYHSALLRMVAP